MLLGIIIGFGLNNLFVVWYMTLAVKEDRIHRRIKEYYEEHFDEEAANELAMNYYLYADSQFKKNTTSKTKAWIKEKLPELKEDDLL